MDMTSGWMVWRGAPPATRTACCDDSTATISHFSGQVLTLRCTLQACFLCFLEAVSLKLWLAHTWDQAARRDEGEVLVSSEMIFSHFVLCSTIHRAKVRDPWQWSGSCCKSWLPGPQKRVKQWHKNFKKISQAKGYYGT